MAWSTEISQLVTETEQFIDAVELKKPVLDAAANTAIQNAASAALAAADTAVIAASLAPSADTSRGHAVATEAIANLTKMQQDAVSDSERQASLAAGYALSAGSIVQQDLSGVTAAALHRSPNAITSMFIYDTSKDSDGGAWTEKGQNTSWYNEDITGRWLGQQPSELFARHEGGSLGPELSVNGNFSSGMTNWANASGGSATIVNNQAVVSTPAGDSYGGIRQDIALSIGKFYQISWDVIAYSSTGWRVEAANNADTGTRTGLGSFSLRFQATTASSLITIAASSNGVNAETATFDNFSIREVTPVTASNDYFQLTTDGKFYRLWKNLLQYTEDFSNGLWTKNGITLTATSNPQEWYLANDGVASGSSITQNFSILANAVFSIEMKADTIRYVRLRYLNVTNTNVLNVDLQTGTSDGGVVTLLSDGFYRISIPYTAGADNAGLISIGITDVFDNAAIAPSASKRVIIRKPQLEYGSTATTYEAKTTLGTTSEVFRGNKRDFPRLAAIVAEFNNLTIYDLTEPGRPMWMRFIGTTGFLPWLSAAININGVSAVNGYIVPVSSSNMGGLVLNFAKDDVILIWNGSYILRKRQLVDRNVLNSFSAEPGGFIVAGTLINGIAMTVLPDAPADPVTGLKVPTIALATTAGLSFIRHNGTVTSITDTFYSFFNSVVFEKRGSIVALHTSSAPFFTRLTRYFKIPETNLTITAGAVGTNGYSIDTSLMRMPGSGGAYKLLSNILRADGNITLYKEDVANGIRSLTATVNPAFNTGWMPGDIKTTLLAETTAVTATEPTSIVTNGDFSTSDVSFWSVVANATTAVVSGRLELTATANYGGISTGLLYGVPGGLYWIEGELVSGTGRFTLAGGYWDPDFDNYDRTGPYKFEGYFRTRSTDGYFQPNLRTAVSGTTTIWDNIKIIKVDEDRSHNNRGAQVKGSVTRSSVATGSSLVGYSGFSSANYLQQPYNEKLEFGTGEFSTSAWVNAPARYNILTKTEQFDDVYWTKMNTTVDALNTNVVIAPDGTMTAEKLVADTTSNLHNVRSPTYFGDASYAASVYLKAAGMTKCALTLSAITGVDLFRGVRATVDLTAGTVAMSNLGSGNSAFFTSSISNVGDGWYRVFLQGQVNFGTSYLFVELLDASGAATFVGDGTNGVYVWGADLRLPTDVGKFPSYQRVNTATDYFGMDGAIVDRAFSSGSSIRIGLTGGKLTSTAFDGTTTRTVTTTAAYNNATWVKAETTYTPDGSLGIRVNGREVAVTRGTPLLSLNSRYNLLGSSENLLDTTSWGFSTVTRTIDTITVTGNANHTIWNTFGGIAAAAGTFTASCEVKAGTASFVTIELWSGATQSGARLFFNLQTSTIGSSSATTGYTVTSTGVTPIGDGWYRIWITGTVPAGTLYFASRASDTDATYTFSAVSGKTWQLRRAQLQAGGLRDYQFVDPAAQGAAAAPPVANFNFAAPMTIGNSFALNAPFPGYIALLKLSATVPTAEQSTFMYEQEKQLFRTDAISILPDATSVLDMSYDDATDRWSAVSATNESYWTGLVRNSVTAVPAGSYSRINTTSGIELSSRITTSPGVDVSIPTYLLSEDLNKRAEAASKAFKEIVNFDYVGGFTASTTIGSTAITSVANLTYPVSTVGARISGTGIPTNATIVAVVGTTMYISAPATAAATGVSISLLDFRLPTGFEAETVATAGAIRREGTTADFTRLFDGFIESIRFAVAPGATAWVQIQASRIIS